MGYKLLTRDMKTRKDCDNEMDWSDVGEWHEAKGSGGLCTNGVIHDYDDPWIAVVVNPAHADIPDPVMYETERGGPVMTDGLKCGCRRLRLTKSLIPPDVPLVQKVAFGIYVALTICDDPDFYQWAANWLSGKDRTYASAAAASDAVYAYAARAAASAAYAAYAADDDHAARAADHAAAYDAAYDAARAAAYAAAYASDAASGAAARAAAYASTRAARSNKDWKDIKAKAMRIK
jgi:hypothetical protein